MIRCSKCGTINPDSNVFCSNCNSFLEWTGVPVDPAEVAADLAKAAAEQAAAQQAEADRLAAEQAAAEQAAAEQAAAEKAEAEKAEAEKAEAEKAEADRLATEQAAAAKAEADRLATEQAAAAKAEADRLAAERAAAEQAAAEQAAAAKAEADRLAVDQAAARQAAAEREAAEQAEADRLAAEQAAAAQAAAAEKAAADKAEADRVAAEQAAAATAAAQRAAAEKAAADRAEADRIAAAQAVAAQAEADRLAAERAEADRVAAEQAAAAQRAAAEKAAADKAEADRVAAEQAAAAQRAAAEKAAADQAGVAAVPAAGEFAATPATAEGQPYEPAAVRPGVKPPPPPIRRLAAPPDRTDEPSERKPTLDIPARPRIVPDSEPQPAIVARPGDVICAVCGTPNDPTRRFCRKCGNSLASAAPAPKPLPWWRRIFRRERHAAAAGERPRRMGEAGQPRPGVLGRLVPLVLIAIVAFGVTSLIVMPGARSLVGGFVTDLRLRFFPQIVDLHPTSASGAGVGQFTGKLAVDDNTATYWLADPSAGPVTLTVDLGTTTNLGGLVFHSGSSTQSDYTKHRRPKTVELTFPGTSQSPIDLTLADTADPQSFPLDVRNVRTVAIRVVDWFESGAGGDQLIAIREIELKERR